MKRIHILSAFLVGLTVVALFPGTRPIVDAMAQNVSCYVAQGGASTVAGSGCTYTYQSGSSLVMESGSALTVNTGTTVTFDAEVVLALENGETINTGTDDVFDFTRDDAGTVTITASDNDATAALTVLPGGAAAMVIGGASTTAVTVTTDGTGTGEVVLPAGSVSGTEITDATLLAADDAFPGRGWFEICGDIATVNNNTVYYGPSQTVVDSTTSSGVTCNTDAAGNTTEATADAPVLTADAIYPTGMVCYSTDMGATGSPLTYTLRSAEADITPSITLAIADNELSGAVSTSATTAIASGATVAVALTSSGDVGAGAFVCRVSYSF